MASHPTRYTPKEYLALERRSDTKHEYFNGEISAMGGASYLHVLLVTNLVTELGSQLKKGPCRVYSSALRLKVDATGLYTYPDVVVICDAPEFSDEQKRHVVEPRFDHRGALRFDQGLRPGRKV